MPEASAPRNSIDPAEKYFSRLAAIDPLLRQFSMASGLGTQVCAVQTGWRRGREEDRRGQHPAPHRNFGKRHRFGALPRACRGMPQFHNGGDKIG
jgi:hypothetical protein